MCVTLFLKMMRFSLPVFFVFCISLGCATRHGDIWVEYTPLENDGVYWPWLRLPDVPDIEFLEGVTTSRTLSPDGKTEVLRASNVPFGIYHLVCPAILLDVPRSISGTVIHHQSRDTRIRFDGNPYFLNLTLMFTEQPPYLFSTHLYLFVHEYVNGIRNPAYYPRLPAKNRSEDGGFVYNYPKIPVRPNAIYTFHVPAALGPDESRYPMESLKLDERYSFRLEIGSDPPEPVTHSFE